MVQQFEINVRSPDDIETSVDGQVVARDSEVIAQLEAAEQLARDLGRVYEFADRLSVAGTVTRDERPGVTLSNVVVSGVDVMPSTLRQFGEVAGIPTTADAADVYV